MKTSFEMLQGLVGMYVAQKQSGNEDAANEMIEMVTGAFINMSAMNYFIDLEKHQGCSEGDSCDFYKHLAEHLGGLLPAIEKDLHLALQVNMKMGHVKFPGWTPVVPLGEEEIEGMSQDGHAMNVNRSGAASVPLSKAELMAVIKGVLSRVDIERLIREGSGPMDPKKMN